MILHIDNNLFSTQALSQAFKLHAIEVYSIPTIKNYHYLLGDLTLSAIFLDENSVDEEDLQFITAKAKELSLPWRFLKKPYSPNEIAKETVEKRLKNS